MDLILNFNKQTLLEYEERGSPLVFEINWKLGDQYYPMKNWTDFGVVIIGWWVVTVVDQLPIEDEGKLHFMDGPYFIKLNYKQQQGVVELSLDESQSSLPVAYKWNITYKDLLSKLLQAVIKIKTELEQNNIGEKRQKERTMLRQCITKLETALAENNNIT